VGERAFGMCGRLRTYSVNDGGVNDEETLR